MCEGGKECGGELNCIGIVAVRQMVTNQYQLKSLKPDGEEKKTFLENKGNILNQFSAYKAP